MLVAAYKESLAKAKEALLAERNESGYWVGRLSSSPVSTAVSVIALHFFDSKKYEKRIENGLDYLSKCALENGGFGDAKGAKANATASILSICALSLRKEKYAKILENAKAYLGGNWDSPEDIKESILAIYGTDLTFSAPILAVCAALGLVGKTPWQLVPKLPWKLALIPQKFFAFLRLPMVSYAIPALVCVGICQDFLAKEDVGKKVSKLKKILAEKLLKKISKMQPESGGFLEASPLTAFCTICLCLAGFKEHKIVKKALVFLENEQREDNSWAIDTNLCQWLTSLSVDALAENMENQAKTLAFFEANAWKEKHKFTATTAGAFSWTNTDGGVPDADDTSAALVALSNIKKGRSDELVENAIKWLLKLQNADGGMPTFCKGWNKLPFDRSCADISAHSLKAFSLWQRHLANPLQNRVRKSILRLKTWLERSQNADGSWESLWFGENDLEGGVSKVLSTAIVLEHISNTLPCANKARDFLLSKMHANGSWGGLNESGAKYLVTAKCISALSKICEKNEKLDLAISKFLTMQEQSEPIGLYFAKLWYSEVLYSKIFGLNAKKNALSYLIKKSQL